MKGAYRIAVLTGLATLIALTGHAGTLVQSKFKSIADFGEATEGHILLQDHGSQVNFHNIKIRSL